jgi:hypothetical protein
VAVKVKARKSASGQGPFHPILFAVTVPFRQPTAQNPADAKDSADDAIQMGDYKAMEDAACGESPKLQEK